MMAIKETSRRTNTQSRVVGRSDRATRLLAAVRRRQLDLAIAGRTNASRRYARWAQIVRSHTP